MEPSTANLAADLVRIHKVITRGIDVSLVKGREYLQTGLSQAVTISGYSSYIHCLVSILDSHHTGEDTIAFPELRHLVPSAPYAKLANDHNEVERLVTPLPQAISDLSDQTHSKLLIIIDALRKLADLWAPHIQIEEYYFSKDTLNSVMSLDDQRRISEATGKYSQENSQPPYWIIPFILYNLDREERAIMGASLPPTVIDELVPKAWAEQWAPMKPFLLD
jgi:hemerythrin-like domain-containing protein